MSGKDMSRKSASIARFSSLLGAGIWFFGLPIVVMTQIVFISDVTYFWIGTVVTVLGVAIAPVVFAYPSGPAAQLARAIVGLGVLACAELVLSGALLMGASVGWLGDKAPGWIPNASAIALTGFFVWVLLASASTARSTPLGRVTFWLGIFAAVSWLLATFDSLVISVHTNATMPIDFISGLLAWLCLPAWLIAMAMRMHRDGGKGKQPATEIG
jgi:hypothetical protein